MGKKKSDAKVIWGQREKVQCMMGMLCRNKDNKGEAVSDNEEAEIVPKLIKNLSR